MSDVIETQLAEIEARANAATPGPWDNEGHTWIYAKVPNGRPNGEGIATFRSEPHHGMPREQSTANAAFTAHARQDIPALVKALRRACKELVYLRPVAELPTRAESDIAAILAQK